MPTDWVMGLIGGIMIGAAASLVLISEGRIAGISGIISGLVGRGMGHRDGGTRFRLLFLAGLLTGGVILRVVSPESLQMPAGRSLPLLALAGIIVGFGTSMGGGCTSGHGVCGLSRFSSRSLVATILYLGVGIVVASLVGAWS